VIALCFLVALAWLLFNVAVVNPITPSGHTFSYDSYLSIMLTALGVMVATFAILVGLAAIWGYAGLKDHLRDIAAKQVSAATEDALKKYPNSADMFKVLQRLKDQADLNDALRNQAVTIPDPKSVATASKSVVQGERSEIPLESADQQVTQIEKYPGEEDTPNASNSRKTD